MDKWTPVHLPYSLATFGTSYYETCSKNDSNRSVKHIYGQNSNIKTLYFSSNSWSSKPSRGSRGDFDADVVHFVWALGKQLRITQDWEKDGDAIFHNFICIVRTKMSQFIRQQHFMERRDVIFYSTSRFLSRVSSHLQIDKLSCTVTIWPCYVLIPPPATLLLLRQTITRLFQQNMENTKNKYCRTAFSTNAHTY